MSPVHYAIHEPYLGWLLQGAWMTLLLTACTTVVSLLLGIPIGMLRSSPRRAIQWGAGLYVQLFRNAPLVPLLLFIVFALPGLWESMLGFPFPRGMEFPLLIAGISLNTSGYIADIYRCGLRAIPRSQVETAQCLGFGWWAIQCRILFPQAIRIAFPALGTRLIHNMKNSSVAIVLPLSVDRLEVLGQTARIAGQTFVWAAPLLFAAATYLAYSCLFSLAVQYLSAPIQRRISGHD